MLTLLFVCFVCSFVFYFISNNRTYIDTDIVDRVCYPPRSIICSVSLVLLLCLRPHSLCFFRFDKKDVTEHNDVIHDVKICKCENLKDQKL